jgi:RNA polymerase sigma-70 factor (ECF subfamily)
MSTRQQRFEHVVHALSGDVYRFVFSLCRSEALAQDVTQEAFLRAWRFFDSLRDGDKARSWLFTTARRELARHFERYQPPLVPLDDEFTAGHQGLDTEGWVVKQALMALPVKYREVLVLQALGGYSGNEIAGILDSPRATVDTRLFRARARLRAVLDQEPGAAGADRQSAR